MISDAADDDFRLAQDLVAMAASDGSVSDIECLIIADICRKQGIPAEVYEAYLFREYPVECDATPIESIDKAEYIKKLICVMGADGNCTEMEIFLLEVIASKIGMRHLELVSLVLSTTSKRHFYGDTGSRILSSFMKNVIDPKANMLRQNHDNMQKILHLIADDIRKDYAADDNPALYARALAQAVSMFIENTLLKKEYEAMGIGLQRTVNEECRRLTGMDMERALNMGSKPNEQS